MILIYETTKYLRTKESQICVKRRIRKAVETGKPPNPIVGQVWKEHIWAEVASLPLHGDRTNL